MTEPCQDYTASGRECDARSAKGKSEIRIPKPEREKPEIRIPETRIKSEVRMTKSETKTARSATSTVSFACFDPSRLRGTASLRVSSFGFDSGFGDSDFGFLPRG